MPMTPYQQFIHKSRYARYLPDQNRRETWEETVQRYCSFFNLDNQIRDAILGHHVMPSMRALMPAGVALEKDNVPGYN